MDNGNGDVEFTADKQRMVEFDLKGRDITDPAVLDVMGRIPREEFVPERYKSQAYFDGPLPVGLGQTISQPYIVALMTQELKLKSDFEVLEIGTGSGYQTAVLASLVKKVYTVERFSQLSESAQAVLARLGFNNIEFFIGDGSCGWPASPSQGGPEIKEFDRIMVTASVPNMPEPLLEQLKIGGLIIAPVGGGYVQRLIVCEKKIVGCTQKAVCDVRFVKLVGQFGFEE
jgi:protein-L-isoaspartate(D-aspartate) O-methyltransferase